MNSKTASVFCLLMMQVYVATGQTTCGGTGNGAQCVWPWTYNSQTLTECTTNNNPQPWCATSFTPGTNNYATWGNCGNCSGTTSIGGSTSSSRAVSTSRGASTTAAPTTAAPTTAAPTAANTTAAPATAAPTTAAPATAAPATAAPGTAAPATAAPTTAAPTTAAGHTTVYSSAVRVAMADPAAFAASPHAPAIMQGSIATAAGILKSLVNVTAVTVVARRLSVIARRLAGSVHVAFHITFPPGHSNPVVTTSSVNTTALVAAIHSHAAALNVNVSVTGVTVQHITLASAGGTTAAPTTAAPVIAATSGAYRSVSMGGALLALVSAVMIAAFGA